jgi:hypothetical protein
MAAVITHKVPIAHKTTDLADVLITSVSDGQVLTWVAADVKWENKTPTGGVTTLEQVWLIEDNYKTLIKPSYYSSDSVSGTGSIVTKKPDFWVITGGTAVGRYAQSLNDLCLAGGGVIFDKNPEFLVYFYVDDVTSGNISLMMFTDNQISGNTRRFGLKILGSNLYIIAADGTTTSTTLIQAISVAVLYRVRVKLNSGVNVSAYVNGSTTPTTQTTNLPSGSTVTGNLMFALYEYSNTASGVDLFVRAVPIEYGY